MQVGARHQAALGAEGLPPAQIGSGGDRLAGARTLELAAAPMQLKTFYFQGLLPIRPEGQAAALGQGLGVCKGGL